jgi:hypothetical protein
MGTLKERGRGEEKKPLHATKRKAHNEDRSRTGAIVFVSRLNGGIRQMSCRQDYMRSMVREIRKHPGNMHDWAPEQLR